MAENVKEATDSKKTIDKVAKWAAADIEKLITQIKDIYLFLPPQFKERILSEVAEGVGVKQNKISAARVIDEQMEQAAVGRVVKDINEAAKSLGKNEQAEFTKRVLKQIAVNLDPEKDSVFSQLMDVKVVAQYLMEKAEKSFPNSKPIVTFDRYKGSLKHESVKPELGKYKFNVTMSHEPGTKLSEFNSFIRDLDKIFGETSIKIPAANMYDVMVGFSVIGNPARLIGNIKRKDPNNLPDVEKIR